MHLQVKVKPGITAFTDDVDDGGVTAESAEYRRGYFSEILELLAGSSFNIRGASGHGIEFGGEFTFWVGKRDGDDTHDASNEAAAALLKDNGYDVRLVEVSYEFLDDEPGTLRAFVTRLQGEGFWVEEITVGTPREDGKIPVQIYTSRTR
jgi:hypothetical protein